MTNFGTQQVISPPTEMVTVTGTSWTVRLCWIFLVVGLVALAVMMALTLTVFSQPKPACDLNHPELCTPAAFGQICDPFVHNGTRSPECDAACVKLDSNVTARLPDYGYCLYGDYWEQSACMEDSEFLGTACGKQGVYFCASKGVEGTDRDCNERCNDVLSKGLSENQLAPYCGAGVCNATYTEDPGYACSACTLTDGGPLNPQCYKSMDSMKYYCQEITVDNCYYDCTQLGPDRSLSPYCVALETGQ